MRCTEVVIPRSRSGPHFVVLQQVGINKHAQLSAVTKGRHATIGLSNPSRATDTGDQLVITTENIEPSTHSFRERTPPTLTHSVEPSRIQNNQRCDYSGFDLDSVGVATGPLADRNNFYVVIPNGDQSTMLATIHDSRRIVNTSDV